jgi:AraC family transcriptional regulator
MRTVEELQTTVERRVTLRGMSAEIRVYNWDREETLLTRPDAFYFTQTLYPSESSYQLLWKLPGSRRFLSVGRFGVTPADAEIEVRRSPTMVRGFLLRVEPDTFHAVTGLEDGWYNERLMIRVNKEGVASGRLLSAMANELSSPGYASETLLEALGTQFLVQFSRMVRDGQRATTSHGLSEWQMNRIREMVESVAADELSIEKIAQACGVSGRHLMRGFKAVMGTTVHRYIDHVRIERTKQLLVSTRTPLEVIAEKVGFSSGSHMSSAFARAEGMPPSLFRQRFGQPADEAAG